VAHFCSSIKTRE